MRKSEAEKMQYMREMNTLAGNVRNITKQKENANAEIQKLKNKLVNQNLTVKQRNGLQKLVEKKRQEKNELTNKIKELEDSQKLMKETHKKMFDAKQEEITKISAERELLRLNATRAARERNNLKVNRNALEAESQRRMNALKEAAEKEAEITKKLGESNKSIQNLTAQRAKLLEKGELNAAEKANLERIRNELTKERNAKNNVIKRLKTLSNERKEALKKITGKFNTYRKKANEIVRKLSNEKQKATKNLTIAKNSLKKTEGWLRTKTNKLAKAEGFITTQKLAITESNKKLQERQNQVGELYRNIKAKNAALAQKNKEAAAALAQKNKEAAAALAQKNRDVQTMTQTIANKNAQIQEALTRVRNANARHETNRAAIAALEAESANLQRNLTAAQELFKQAASERATARWKRAIGNAASSKKINKLKNNTKALGKEIQNGKRTLTATQRTLNQTKETLAFEQKQLGNAEVAIQELRKNKTNLTKNKTNLKTRLVGTKWKGIVGNRKLNQTRGQLQTAQRAATLNQQRAQAKINATKGQLNATKGQLNATKGQLNATKGQLRNVQKTLPGLKNSKYREKLYKLVDAKVNKSLVVRNRPLNLGLERRRLKNQIMNPETTVENLKKIESQIQSKIKAAKNAKGFSFGNNTQGQPVQTREQVTFRDFAASGRPGLDNTIRTTGNRRSKVEKILNRL